MEDTAKNNFNFMGDAVYVVSDYYKILTKGLQLGYKHDFVILAVFLLVPLAISIHLLYIFHQRRKLVKNLQEKVHNLTISTADAYTKLKSIYDKVAKIVENDDDVVSMHSAQGTEDETPLLQYQDFAEAPGLLPPRVFISPELHPPAEPYAEPYDEPYVERYAEPHAEPYADAHTGLHAEAPSNVITFRPVVMQYDVSDESSNASSEMQAAWRPLHHQRYRSRHLDRNGDANFMNASSDLVGDESYRPMAFEPNTSVNFRRSYDHVGTNNDGTENNRNTFDGTEYEALRDMFFERYTAANRRNTSTDRNGADNFSNMPSKIPVWIPRVNRSVDRFMEEDTEETEPGNSTI